eukprot:15032050-Ditylum_brightwellii.AAC.1
MMFKKQLKYLKLTKKPFNLSCGEWIGQIHEINNMLLLLQSRATSLSEEEIMDDVITLNLPGSLVVSFIKDGSN